MECFHLTIASSAQAGMLDVALSLDGQDPKTDTIQESAFGDLDAICDKLNDRSDRNHAGPIGRDLFERVFVKGRPLHNFWYGLTERERRIPMNLALEAVEVSPYPWELMRDADDIIPALAGGLLRRSRSRGTSLAALGWPLRFLIILGTNDATIQADQEFETLKQELGDLGRSIDVYALNSPSSQEIQEALRHFQPNIIHFIGHSVAGGLLVKGKTGNWTWATANIGNNLADAKCSPALVFLNSCRTASLSGAGDVRRWTRSVQEQFARSAAFVIAMQADVPGDLALRFSHEFYRKALKQLQGGQCPCVSHAVKAARDAVTTNLDSLDWALPSLTVQRQMDSEFVLRYARAWPTTPEFAACKEFEETRLFANCGEERRRLVDWLLPIDPEAREQNVLILHAPEDSGRSHLVKWCTETWAAQDGFAVCYRDAGSVDGMNSFKLLILIRTEPGKPSGTSDRLLHESLPLDPFRPF